MSTKVVTTPKNNTPVHRTLTATPKMVKAAPKTVKTVKAKAKVNAVAVKAAPKTVKAVVKVASKAVKVASDDQLHDDNEATKLQVDTKKKRRPRPKTRTHAEIFADLHEQITLGYKALQSASKLIKSLESAHNREVHNTRSRANTQRTPTIVFDQPLVDYFTSKLSGADLSVTRKENDEEITVDLTGLNTETRVHRTDVTQLYNKAFVKNNMRRETDKRYIMYQKDPALVALLTEGITKPELKEGVDQILAGTYELTICNIQRFTSQHLGKVALPVKSAE